MKILIGAIISFVLASCSYLPLFENLNPPAVRVDDHRDYLELTPTSGPINPIGLMFWPGGLVDPQAYRGSLGEFASRGYRVVIAKVPANLAITSITKGWDLAQRLGGQWVAAGHSLGGTTAAWTIHDHPQVFRGLVLMASYPTEDKTLANWNRPVLSIYGEFDGLAGPSIIGTKKGLLPPEGSGPGFTRYYEILGGNHGQFGAYGPQDKDGQATISPKQQWGILADELVVLWGTL